MATEAQRMGITPYVLRLASYYAALGVGEYTPNGYAWFDRVEVKQLMPWTAGEAPTESCLILIVEFYQGETRRRYVEFALTPAGWGGEPLFRVLEGAAVPKVITENGAPDQNGAGPE